MLAEFQPLRFDAQDKGLGLAYVAILPLWQEYLTNDSAPSITALRERETAAVAQYYITDEELAALSVQAFCDAHDIVHPDKWKLEQLSEYMWM